MGVIPHKVAERLSKKRREPLILSSSVNAYSSLPPLAPQSRLWIKAPHSWESGNSADSFPVPQFQSSKSYRLHIQAVQLLIWRHKQSYLKNFKRATWITRPQEPRSATLSMRRARAGWAGGSEGGLCGPVTSVSGPI